MVLMFYLWYASALAFFGANENVRREITWGRRSIRHNSFLFTYPKCLFQTSIFLLFFSLSMWSLR